MRIYRADRFAVQLPEEWEDVTSYMFIGPGGFPMVNIAVQDAPDRPVSESAAQMISAFREAFKGFEMVSEFSREISGCPAVDFSFLYEDHTGKRFYQRRLVLVRGGKMYILTGNGPGEDMDDLGRRFDAVFQSLTFHEDG